MQCPATKDGVTHNEHAASTRACACACVCALLCRLSLSFVSPSLRCACQVLGALLAAGYALPSAHAQEVPLASADSAVGHSHSVDDQHTIVQPFYATQASTGVSGELRREGAMVGYRVLNAVHRCLSPAMPCLWARRPSHTSLLLSHILALAPPARASLPLYLSLHLLICAPLPFCVLLDSDPPPPLSSPIFPHVPFPSRPLPLDISSSSRLCLA